MSAQSGQHPQASAMSSGSVGVDTLIAYAMAVLRAGRQRTVLGILIGCLFAGADAA
jgi:hypothetical protein